MEPPPFPAEGLAQLAAILYAATARILGEIEVGHGLCCGCLREVPTEQAPSPCCGADVVPGTQDAGDEFFEAADAESVLVGEARKKGGT